MCSSDLASEHDSSVFDPCTNPGKQAGPTLRTNTIIQMGKLRLTEVKGLPQARQFFSDEQEPGLWPPRTEILSASPLPGPRSQPLAADPSLLGAQSR